MLRVQGVKPQKGLIEPENEEYLESPPGKVPRSPLFAVFRFFSKKNGHQADLDRPFDLRYDSALASTLSC